MKSILVVGIGRFGRHICRKLMDMGAEVMAVDIDEDRVAAIAPYVTDSMVGDMSKGVFLNSLGVRNFDCCVVAIGDDVLASIEITSELKDAGAKKVISRASRDSHERLLIKNGADEVIYPEKLIAESTAMRVGLNSVFDYLELAEGYGVFEVETPEKWCGHSILELNIRNRYNLNIMAVRENKQMHIAVGPDFVFKPGQQVLLIGSGADFSKCFRN